MFIPDNRSFRVPVVVALLATALTICNEARAEWSSDATYVCDDPLIIRQQSFFLNWFPRPGSVVLTRFLQEKYRVEINQKYVNDGSIRTGVPFTSNRVEMDSGRLSLLRYIVEKRSNDSDLPFYITDDVKLAAYILTAGETLVITPIFNFLFALEKVRHAKISLLENFLAEGGELIQLGQIEKLKNNNYIAIETIRYRVSLGKETRSFLIYSCVYPAIVVMRRVITTYPPNNKMIYEGSGDNWVGKNAETGTVVDQLKKLREDDDFYYFTRSRGGELRISRHGGPVESLNAGTWSPIYQRTQLD
jgi:hypothetical protein